MYFVNDPSAIIAKKDAVIPKISDILVKKETYKISQYWFQFKES